jgi:hypothetical protein
MMGILNHPVVQGELQIIDRGFRYHHSITPQLVDVDDYDGLVTSSSHEVLLRWRSQKAIVTFNIP